MIDINELRRLAQAATPGGWYVERGNYVYGCKEVTDGEEEWHPIIACTDDDEVSINFEGNAKFIAAANPAVINELLDRLEESESDCLEQARLNGMGASREATLMAKLKAAEKSDAESIAMYRKAGDERDALYAKVETAENDAAHQKALADSALRVAEGWERKCGELRAALQHETDCVEAAKAKIEALRSKTEEMEKQEPFDADSDVFRGAFEAALKAGNWPATRQGDGYRSPSTQFAWIIAFSTVNRLKLYLAPGAQAHPAPPEQDESVRKSWVRFSNELHRSPDAPYPGMSEAFEQHFSQSFTDRDWRVESGVWAAAWKAAKHHGAKGE